MQDLSLDNSQAPELGHCKWCQAPMRSTAIRCARCRQFRADIHNDRFLVYVLSGFAVGLGMIGFSRGWWAYDMFDTFAFNRFVTSLSGWIVLAPLTAALALYLRVSRKLTTWLWI